MNVMYDDLATWWPLLSPVEDYAEEAAYFLEVLESSGIPAEASLIEFGCGGGNNAWHMKKRFREVVLTDLSPSMLAISAEVNPECEHVAGDMRTLDVGRTFDAVFIHDAIDYMTSVEDLNSVFLNVARHTRPGGVALLVPDYTRESFEAGSDHGGSDGAGRGLRFLEWCHDPDPDDCEIVVDYVFICREGDAPPQVSHETHHCGLFARDVWFNGLAAAGFSVTMLEDDYGREVFLGRRQ